MGSNNIYVFGLDCTTGSSQTAGKVLTDESWQASPDRASGTVEGLASSQIFNTVLRQSSLMARVLGGIIANRYNEDVTTDQEDSLDTVADRWANLFSATGSTVFLKDSEVTTSKIADESVVTSKIQTATSTTTGVVGEKLGSILLGSQSNRVTTSANGMMITVSQGDTLNDSGYGRLKFLLTGTSVLKSDTLKHTPVLATDKDKHYLLGTDTETASYTEGKIHSKIYAQMYEDESILYSPTFIAAGGTPLAGETGYVQAEFFNATSDRRLKTNIQEYAGNALDLILNTPVYTYSFLKRSKPDLHIGIMAQDIMAKELLLVTQNHKGYLGLKEDKLIYILWKAIQEQQKQIEELKKR